MIAAALGTSVVAQVFSSLVIGVSTLARLYTGEGGCDDVCEMCVDGGGEAAKAEKERFGEGKTSPALTLAIGVLDDGRDGGANNTGDVAPDTHMRNREIRWEKEHTMHSYSTFPIGIRIRFINSIILRAQNSLPRWWHTRGRSRLSRGSYRYNW